MKFDLERSILYDTIRYTDIYFNEQIIKQYHILNECNPIFYEEIYQKILQPQLSEKIRIFCTILKQHTYTFLQLFFSNNMNYIDSLEKLISSLKDKNLFEKEFNDILLNGNQRKNMELEKISPNYSDHRVNISFAYVIGDFKNAVDILAESLILIHKEITKLYYKKPYCDLVKSIKVLDNDIAFFLTKGINITLLKDAFYCVSLLHPYACRYTNYDNLSQGLFLILGTRFREAYNLIPKTTNIFDTFNVFSEPLAWDILDIFYKHGELSIPDIIEFINNTYEYSKATIYKLVSMLHNCGMLKRTVDSKPNYYQINQDYIDYILLAINEKILYYKNKNIKELNNESI